MILFKKVSVLRGGWRWFPNFHPGLVLGLLLGILSHHQAVATEPADPTQPYVGIGLDGFSYWGDDYALADLQAQSEYVNFSWGLPNVDAKGWPLTDVRVLVSSDQLAVGTYKVMAQGQIQAINPSAGAVANLVYNATTNETTADWILSAQTSGNVWLDFTNTRRTNAGALNTGFVNLHIWRPGIPTDGSVMFMPHYLAAIEDFSLLRSMGVVNANGNPAQHWSDRALMGWAGETVDSTNSPWGIAYAGTNAMYNGTATNTYWPGGYVSDRGRPWEMLVLLANATTNDLWINLPVRVDDDYVTKLAQLLCYGSDGVNPYTSPQVNPVYPPLNQNLKIYIEYGNEVWNTGPGFNCFYWVADLTLAALNDPNHPICYDGIPDQNTGHFRYTAWRSSTISLIFRQVFGDAAMMTKVRPILSAQVGNANQVLQIGLQWADGFYREVRSNNPAVLQPSDLWYGGGGAAYYDSTVAPFLLETNLVGTNLQVTAYTTPDLMTQYFAGLPNPDFAESTAVDATWTKAYGLKLTSYEGGPGPGGSSLGGIAGAAVAPLYNADPRMKTCMIAAQNIWIANGGDLLTYFDLTGDGPWGFGDNTNTDTSTNTIKLQAIDAIRSQPGTSVTLGTQVPATIPVATNPAAAIIITGGYIDPATGLQSIGAGADPAQSPALLFPLHPAAPGTYKFALGFANTPGATVELLVNGQSAGIWTLPAANASGIIDSARLTATLTNGLNVARLRVLSGSTEIHDLTVLSLYAADPPTFAPPAGTYNDSQSIQLSATTPGASIYYTTDGSLPSPTNGMLYAGPFPLNVSATINALVVASGYTNSPVSTANYVINNINYGVLAGWDFSGAGGHAATDGDAASVASTYHDPGAQPGTLTLSANASPAALYWGTGEGAMNTRSFTLPDLAAAKANGDYFQFAVAPVAGNTLSLSSLTYVAYQQELPASGPLPTMVTEYSTNGFATPGASIDTNDTIQAGWAGNAEVINLAGISALQNTAATVTFRLWGYGFGAWQDSGLGEVPGDDLDVAVKGTATVPGAVLLGAQMRGANLQLSWPQGTLLEATNITGPWITNPAASPYSMSPTAPWKFFRVKVQ